ncbi:P-II family nitrogen regulator [Fusibacter bizertensis]
MISNNNLYHSLYNVTLIVSSKASRNAKKIAKSFGVLGSTTLLCKGTIDGKLLGLLDLNEQQQEMVIFLTNGYQIADLVSALHSQLKLSLSNHGIMFVTEIKNILGKNIYLEDVNIDKDNFTKTIYEGDFMYNSIYVVVDKGNGNDVIASSKRAGARGGTIFSARGSGIHETQRLFSMDIEPEKEVVMILVPASETDHIAATIVSDLRLDLPGNGILYVQELLKAYGIY